MNNLMSVIIVRFVEVHSGVWVLIRVHCDPVQEPGPKVRGGCSFESEGTFA